VENIESGVEHFIIYVYEYNIKPLGKCFIRMDIKSRVGTLHIQKSRSEDIHEILEKKVPYIYISKT
jgi:hypothetical protein